MAHVTKDAWGRSSLRTDEVEVPELGGSVRIRELPADVAADLQGLIDVVQVGREQRAKVSVGEMERRQFAYGVIDDSDEPMFTLEEVGDLQHKHGKAFRTVVDAIDKLSGLDKQSIQEAEARFPGGGTGANGSDVGVAGGPGDEPAVPARAGARARTDDPGTDDG